MDENLQKLKEQVEILTKKLEARAVDAEKDKFQAMQKEVQELKNKYIFLLENIVKMQSQEKWKVPEQVSKPEPSISNLQMLLLLRESRATSKQFAVTAKQLKEAYNIKKTERTVRNKLNYLELYNFIASFGKKPKAYFVTPSGLSRIKEQTRGSMNIKPGQNINF